MPEDHKLNNVLDNADSRLEHFFEDIEDMRRIASDPQEQLDERLDAFEDIMESEVGDTTMLRARNIEREFGMRQLYLKFEGNNPTGTQKDRISFAQVMDAMRRGFDGITMATCGNYGVAMATAASMAGMRCLIHIPEKYHTRRAVEMEQLGAQIIRTPGDYEQSVQCSRQFAVEREVYDANPGGDNTILQLRSYGEIAYEIYDELRDAPAAVAVPMSNGTTIAGIHKGFQSLYRRGKTSRMPRIVGGSSFNKNPIVLAWIKNLETCEDLSPGKIHETTINEPLINWHSIDGDWALDAIRSTNGWAGNASDKDLLHFARILREREGLHALPASTAGLVALLDRTRKDPLPNDRYVVVLTGRKT